MSNDFFTLAVYKKSIVVIFLKCKLLRINRQQTTITGLVIRPGSRSEIIHVGVGKRSCSHNNRRDSHNNRTYCIKSSPPSAIFPCCLVGGKGGGNFEREALMPLKAAVPPCPLKKESEKESEMVSNHISLTPTVPP